MRFEIFLYMFRTEPEYRRWATRLRAGRSRIRLPIGARDSSLLRNAQTGSGVQPASVQWVMELFPEY